MKVLVIGNGFDLAHNLQTKYSDFMEFVKQFNLVYEANEKDNNFRIRSGSFINFLIKLFRTNDYETSKIVHEFRQITKENIWMSHFFYVLEGKKKIGENWIDFEKEISNVIQWMDDTFDSQYKNNQLDLDKFEDKYIKGCNERKFIVFASDFKNKRNELRVRGKESIEDLEHMLINSYVKNLEDLTRAFEIYLTAYVLTNIETNFEQDILDLNLQETDAIISFNYTDTYNRLYKNNSVPAKNIHFIHGKALLNNKENNMIIGIDEYLPEAEQDIRLKYVRFKKYFQRIVKETDASYKLILDDNHIEDDGMIEIFVFGHSLDVTDRDIIKELFTHNRTKVTVFSHDKENQKQQVANLIKIVGKDELIKSTYNSEPKVKFRLQVSKSK